MPFCYTFTSSIKIKISTQVFLTARKMHVTRKKHFQEAVSMLSQKDFMKMTDMDGCDKRVKLKFV